MKRLSFTALVVLPLFACHSLAIATGIGANNGGDRAAVSVTLDNPFLDEISGLARSARHSDLLWAHNDSGDGPNVYALNSEGKYQGRVTIANADAEDWEDMAQFEHEGMPHLLLGDVGDNRGLREFVSLYAIIEPELPNRDRKTGHWHINADIAWRIDVVYPDGPRDCEAVAVHGDTIWLLSKRDQPPRLYAVPLKPDSELVMAEFSGELTSLGNGGIVNQPTAMDIAPDGHSAIVTTYGDAYWFHGVWPIALVKQPQVVDVPNLRQAEAGVIAAGGQSLFIISERLPAPLVNIPLTPP